MSPNDGVDTAMGDAVADAAADVDDEPLVPARGEIERLADQASARAMKDGTDALRLCASANEPFKSVEDACSRLIPFHVFATPGELSWHAAREDESESETKSQPYEGKAASVSKLSNEECWRRDVDTFSKSIMEFMNESSSALVRPTKGQHAGAPRPVLSTEEDYLVERLMCEHSRKQLYAERIDRQVSSARNSTMETEIWRYQDFIRRRAEASNAAVSDGAAAAPAQTNL